jgi:hypothetical protein
MTVLIRIDYITNENKVMRKGEFPLRGKIKEQAAYEFWQWIKNEHPYECEIEKVIVDNEDITEKVMELDAAPLD